FSSNVPKLSILKENTEPLGQALHLYDKYCNEVTANQLLNLRGNTTQGLKKFWANVEKVCSDRQLTSEQQAAQLPSPVALYRMFDSAEVDVMQLLQGSWDRFQLAISQQYGLTPEDNVGANTDNPVNSNSNPNPNVNVNINDNDNDNGKSHPKINITHLPINSQSQVEMELHQTRKHSKSKSHSHTPPHVHPSKPDPVSTQHPVSEAEYDISQAKVVKMDTKQLPSHQMAESGVLDLGVEHVQSFTLDIAQAMSGHLMESMRSERVLFTAAQMDKANPPMPVEESVSGMDPALRVTKRDDEITSPPILPGSSKMEIPLPTAEESMSVSHPDWVNAIDQRLTLNYSQVVPTSQMSLDLSSILDKPMEEKKSVPTLPALYENDNVIEKSQGES
ncbi:hypothetical protein RFI_11308, partial [Reticulomyxa filosa]